MSYTYEYPHAAITADCCVFGFDGTELQVLLIQRKEDPFKGQWAFPGGFLRMDETIEECALRELRSETQLKPRYIEQFHVFSSVDRDPRERVVTVAFLALVPISAVRGGDDAAKARWFPVDKILHLAFDHQIIYERARLALKERLHQKPLGYWMLDRQFTSSQLQLLYQTILGDSVESKRMTSWLIERNQIRPSEPDAGIRDKKLSDKLYSFATNSYAKFRVDSSAQGDDLPF